MRSFSWYGAGKLLEWNELYTNVSHSNVIAVMLFATISLYTFDKNFSLLILIIKFVSSRSEKENITKKYQLQGKVDNSIWASSKREWDIYDTLASRHPKSIETLRFFFTNINKRGTTQVNNLLQLLFMTKHANVAFHGNRKCHMNASA